MCCVTAGSSQQPKPEYQPPIKPRWSNGKNTGKFFDFEVSQLPPRKPVRWLSPNHTGTADDRLQATPSQQGHQKAAEDDPWLLGEARTPHPLTTRPRLSWATHHNNQSSAHVNQRQSQQNQQPVPSNHQQAPEDPVAAAARQEQYLRNMRQIQRQEAEHAAKKARREAQSTYPEGQEEGYQDLSSGVKRQRKADSSPQPVAAAAREVVIPPDVTLRQLAQLLGKLAAVHLYQHQN